MNLFSLKLHNNNDMAESLHKKGVHLFIIQFFFVFIYSSDVGFMVYPSSHITTTWGAKLRFNRVDRNDGQGYNVSTGMFTAPVAGMYHFYWSLLFHRGGYVTINFELNGAEKIRSYRDTDDGTHSSTSGSIYLRLKVGDQVYLEASRSGGMVQNGRYSTFGGELIRH